MPALRTWDLAVGYRTRRTRRAVLERVNVSVERGELVCLLGPNGIGKSTLLRTIARMQPPLWGGVEMGGIDIAAVTHRDLARQLGVVLTDRIVPEALRVADVVALGRYPHAGWFGRFDDRSASVVRWALDAVGARHLEGYDFTRLSDGERQRVMIARALAQEPSVLVLDEPTAFLDVPSRVELVALLRRLARSEGVAVIVSTHDLELALRTADTVWLVTPGGEVMTGAPEDIVLAGGIAQAFEGRHIRFDGDSRTFRLLTGHRGTAFVTGGGLREALARAVVEREGYEVAGSEEACTLRVDVDGRGWRVSQPVPSLSSAADPSASSAAGVDFASLSAWLREGREDK